MPYHTVDSMNLRPKDDAVIPRWVTKKIPPAAHRRFVSTKPIFSQIYISLPNFICLFCFVLFLLALLKDWFLKKMLLKRAKKCHFFSKL